MSTVKLFPCRRTQDLHAIITASQQSSPENVDRQMKPLRQPLRLSTIAFEDNTGTLDGWMMGLGPCQDAEVGEEDDTGDEDTQCDTVSPAAFELLKHPRGFDACFSLKDGDSPTSMEDDNPWLNVLPSSSRYDEVSLDERFKSHEKESIWMTA